MTDDHELIITALHANHDRAGFRCGVEALDRYLAKQANQDIRRRISRVFVATPSKNPEKVLGYYTLSALSIELSRLPDNLTRKLPRHPVPSALIGRLAVTEVDQGLGIGKMMLADAIRRTLAVGDQIAIYAMVVDALDDNAKRFYERFGFTPLVDGGLRLFLPLKSIKP